jgi:TolA-binding protein
MLQIDMSKKLVLLVMLLAMLPACAAQPDAVPAEAAPCPDASNYSELQEWLAMENRTSRLDTEQVVSELIRLGRPEGSTEVYLFGLLNQQLGTPSNWRQARNAFRQVKQDEQLTAEQRRIAAILEGYNISRLDSDKYRRDLVRDQKRLESELRAREQEIELLQQKIQAITDLEASMSTRKEQ